MIAYQLSPFKRLLPAEIGALDAIRAAKGESPPTVAGKILDDNPRRFYGL
jgi:hypothetical protein